MCGHGVWGGAEQWNDELREKKKEEEEEKEEGNDRDEGGREGEEKRASVPISFQGHIPLPKDLSSFH
jgi:hypothetical protein